MGVGAAGVLAKLCGLESTVEKSKELSSVSLPFRCKDFSEAGLGAFAVSGEFVLLVPYPNLSTIVASVPVTKKFVSLTRKIVAPLLVPDNEIVD